MLILTRREPPADRSCRESSFLGKSTFQFAEKAQVAQFVRVLSAEQ